MLSPQVCLQPQNTRNTLKKKTHTHLKKIAQTVVQAVAGAAVFPSFHPPSLFLSPSRLFFFLPSLGFPPVWCRSVLQKGNCPPPLPLLLLPPSVESFPSSPSFSLPLSSRLNATEPRSHAARENTQCAAVLPVRFPHARQCMRARHREHSIDTAVL